VTVPAARLVLLGCANEHRLTRVRRGLAVDEPLRRRRRATAAVADGLKLVHELGVGEKLGNRAERQAAKVLIEPCGDNPGAAFGRAVGSGGMVR